MVIATIVEKWPTLVAFDPTPLSVETFSCRLRDAIRSHRQNQWPSTFVPLAKFLQIVDEITVSTSHTTGKVVVGPEELLRKAVPLSTEAFVPELEQVVPVVHLTDPPEELWQAVLVMHHHRILTEPSRIDFTVVPENFGSEVAKYDVEWSRDGSSFTIL